MNSSLLVIANKNYSSWSLRAWLVLKELGVPFEELVVPLDRPDTAAKIKEYSPSAKAPVWVVEGAVIWDSLAICEEALDRTPHQRLRPKDPALRARLRSLCAEMHSGFLGLRAHLPMNCRLDLPGFQVPAEAAADVARMQEMLVAELENSGGPYLAGEFSWADAFFAPVALRFRSYHVPLPPLLESYVARLLDRPHLKEWVRDAKAETFLVQKYEREPTPLPG